MRATEAAGAPSYAASVTDPRDPRADPMHRPSRSPLVGLAVIVSLAACSGAKGPSDAEVEKRIATELRAQGLSGTEATCFAREVVKTVGVDKVKDVKFDAAAPPPAVAKDIATAAQTAIESCKIDVPPPRGG